MSADYRLTFINNSQKTGSICLFPVGSDHADPHNALVWRTQPVHPGTQAVFTWNTQYCFLWNLPGSGPGGATYAQQILPIDPPNNLVTLSKSDGAYLFGEPKPGPQPDLIYISCDNTVTPHEASVGFGMADSGMVLMPAQPNLNFVFQPFRADSYQLAFGEFETGRSLADADLSLSTPVQFPVNAFAVTVALNLDLTWSKVFSQ